MSTDAHNEVIQEWFGRTVPTHYFHNGEGTEWYVFRNEGDNDRYLIMLSWHDSPLKAVAIADDYQTVTDLYNMVKAHNPNARWVH